MSLTDVLLTQGVTVTYTVSSNKLTAKLRSVQFDGIKSTVIKTTDLGVMDLYHTFKQGMRDAGGLRVTVEFDPEMNTTTLLSDVTSLATGTGTLVVTFPDPTPGSGAGATFSVSAFCDDEVPGPIEVDGELLGEYHFKFTGKPTLVASS